MEKIFPVVAILLFVIFVSMIAVAYYNSVRGDRDPLSGVSSALFGGTPIPKK